MLDQFLWGHLSRVCDISCNFFLLNVISFLLLQLTDSSIAQLSSSLGRVETLDLRGCKQIKDNCIRRVVKNCTRLKQLSLANCPNITDVSILEIATYLTDIRYCVIIGDKKIIAIFTQNIS